MDQSGFSGHNYHSGLFYHAACYGHEGTFQLRRGVWDRICYQVFSITGFPLLFYFL
jgi:hypothetical protein